MLMQTISPMTGNLRSSQTDSGSVKGKQAAGGFDMMLSNLKSSAANASTAAKNKQRVVSGKLDGNKEAKNQDIADGGQQTISEPKTNPLEARQKVPASAKDEKAAYEADDAGIKSADDEIIGDDLLEQISAMVNVLSEIIMDKLGLNAEEFNKLLEDLNMTSLDLLDQDKLQNFILACNNENEDNVLALLTNENLSSIMKDISSQIDSLKDEAGIPQNINIDELKELIAAAEQNAVEDSDSQENIAFKNQDISAINESNTIGRQTTGTDKASDSKSISTDIKVEAAKTETEQKSDSIQAGQPGSDNTADDNKSTDLKEQNTFQSFVDNMVKSVENSSAYNDENVADVSKLKEIAYQIVEKIRLLIKPDQTSLEINLSPESLGKVNLTIHSREGVMTARFVCENQVSKEAIESQLNELRQALNQQGIKVEEIEVTVAAYAFDQSNSSSEQNQPDSRKSNSGKHITMEEAIGMSDDAAAEEDSADSSNGLTDNQINYMA